MSVGAVGQRCVSEREPELGLGVVTGVDAGAKRIAVDFPAAGEKRLYALGTPVLRRVQFRAGDTVTTRDGVAFVVEAVEEGGGVAIYVGGGRRVPEDAISDVTSVASPVERLSAGQVDDGDVFDLRFKGLQAQARFRQSPVRGYLGGRVDLIPHQFYILHEVSSRQIPRVLLADEVGLGKTIEACLIVQRLLAIGQARRVLILVPESLLHQWFVELLRRFNLWFTLYDEARCAALEQSDPGVNPFLASQLALAAVGFVAGSPERAAQAVGAGWDMLVVDEAHHLAWSPESVSPQYAVVAQLAERTPGLLLLTATPTQLGLAGHFARLRLLDPHRYHDYAGFVAESERFGAVARVASRVVEGKALSRADGEALAAIFNRDPQRLHELLAAVEQGRRGARPALLQTLLDQHGTGRVMFRNTRAAIAGFPGRKFCPARLDAEGSVALLARIARELNAEAEGTEAAIRYSYRDDPRLAWLVDFLRARPSEKILLICKSQRKVAAIEGALQERIKVKAGVFHEGLPLVQRDRQAAWFAEPEGAQLLLCSEIGSEGRNFQFAHQLVLFDLPLNPALLEQRIGRLDRIGQTRTIEIHVPWIGGSADEVLVEWYHRGLDAFEAAVPGGNEYVERFGAHVLEVALGFGGAKGGDGPLERLVAETAAFRAELAHRMKEGRDRLLELHSFRPEVAEEIMARVRAADADPFLRTFLLELLDHFGVRIKEHEEGDVFLDPSHAYLEAFPSIPSDGMLATFNRARATTREDIRFLSADHPLVQDAIDLLIDSPKGTTAFATLAAKTPNLLLEAVFVVEAVADSRWGVDRFFAPAPVRVVVDVRGQDLSAEHPAAAFAADLEDGDIHRFLEQPGFTSATLQALVARATERAELLRAERVAQAAAMAESALRAERQRLVDLRKMNDHIRPEEIGLIEQQLEQVKRAIAGARLRLDAVRLVLQGPVAAAKKR